MKQQVTISAQMGNQAQAATKTQAAMKTQAATQTPAQTARTKYEGGTGRAVVVGGGLAGLMATLKLVEAGIPVDLFSVVPVKRSHSVCAQGGINAALDTKGEGDSVWEHIDDTIYGGDFLANQNMVARMCEAAPSIINLFDRMGVMFNRTPEGLLDLRRFGGTQKRRTAFAGATTGQQLLYALDEQVRAQEVAGMVKKYEYWTFVSAIIDEGVVSAAGVSTAGVAGTAGASTAGVAGTAGDEAAAADSPIGICKGIVAQDLASMEIRAFPADAVIIATGGCGAIFGKSTNSTINTGYAAAKLYTQGARYANGEFIQIHPTAIPGADKNRLMSESARGEGGRVWTYKDGKPWYFLEEKYPAYGNLVPRDIATREIYDVIYNQHLGVNGENVVYLDVSHIDPTVLDNKLGGILEIYEKFVGDNPRKVPMRIAPSVHYSMGGLWVDAEQHTNIPGLFAAGECDYSQHGANRLGANSLLSAVYGGLAAGPSAALWIKGLPVLSENGIETLCEQAAREEQAAYDTLLAMDGSVNPYELYQRMATLMTENVTVVRYNDALAHTLDELDEIAREYEQIGIHDNSTWNNTTTVFVRELGAMIELAKVITAGALARDESRGSHYKPEFPERDDEAWLKTTLAEYDAQTKRPRLAYEPVDVSLIEPRKRDYSKVHEVGKRIQTTDAIGSAGATTDAINAAAPVTPSPTSTKHEEAHHDEQ